MTTEQRIRHRLRLGATYRPDGRGVTMELEGYPTTWTVKHLWDEATAGLGLAVGQSTMVASTPTAETRSEALTAFLALAEKRA